MAELPCFLSWRWAQGQAVTREDSSVPPSTISPTSRLRCGDYRVCHPGMSRGGGGTGASRHTWAGGIFILLAQVGSRGSEFASASSPRLTLPA